jgi:hypothetical protein
MTHAWGDAKGWMGGPFALAEAGAAPRPLPWSARGVAIATADARSALKIVRDLVAPRRVWLPSYLCDSVLSGLSDGDTALTFYPVDLRLQLPDRRWLSSVRQGDLAVFVSYFGFPADRQAADEAHARGAITVWDGACALLSEMTIDADFAVLSPRKFVGIPDGGVVLCRRAGDASSLAALRLSPPPALWWRSALEMCRGRPAFDRGQAGDEWLALCEQAEDAPKGALAMSELSARLLATAFDWGAIAQRRRVNYAALARALPDLALLPALPAGSVPFGFPIRLRDRDAVRARLRQSGVLTPIHWELPPAVPGEFVDSHRLSAETLTLPCDQRYGLEDMDRLARLVTSARPAE